MSARIEFTGRLASPGEGAGVRVDVDLHGESVGTLKLTLVSAISLDAKMECQR